MLIIKLLHRYLTTFGSYLILMGRTFQRPERLRMFAKRYVKEMSQLGVDSIGIVLLISFFIGAVICIQMKVNIQSPCKCNIYTFVPTLPQSAPIYIHHSGSPDTSESPASY